MGAIIRKFESVSVDTRHGLYVWWMSFCTLCGIMALAWFKTGAEALTAIKALADILVYIVCSYLGIDAISRSGVMQGMGDRLRGGTPTPPPTSSVPDTTTHKPSGG